VDLVGGIIARLDRRSPIWADRLRWRRTRRDDLALRVVDALVSRGDVVVDVGASRGLFSSRMHDLVGRRGAVHAFEPNPAHHQRLQAVADDGTVTVYPAALSDHEGHATLQVPLIDGRAYTGLASLEQRSDPSARTVIVPTLRLDDVLGPDEPLSFIKCDVEGHEDAVMRGARGVLTRNRPAVLVEIEQRHRIADAAKAFDEFRAMGYAGWALFPGGLRPLDAFDLERDQLAFLASPRAGEIMPRGYVHNFLFLPPDTDVGSLLDRAAERPAGANRASRAAVRSPRP
jgi:FkbM family methyltransferase